MVVARGQHRRVSLFPLLRLKSAPCPSSPLPRQGGPLDGILHELLGLVDALQRVERLVEEEGGVVDEHVDEADELLPGARLPTNGLSVRRDVPK